jgi:hypothetical protein
MLALRARPGGGNPAAPAVYHRAAAHQRRLSIVMSKGGRHGTSTAWSMIP